MSVYQHGSTDYMSEAAWAQATEGYGYGDAITSQNKTWAMLNPEQQGQLIQDAYGATFFQSGQWVDIDLLTKKAIGSNAFMTKYMQTVVPQLHSGQGAT